MKKESSVYPAWIMLTITFVIIALAFLLFFLLKYKTEKSAKGFEDEIYVVADSAEYEAFSKSLKSIFEKEITTPQSEKLFNLKRIDSNELEKNKTAKNLIIAAPENSGSKTSQYISSIKDPAIQNELKSDSDAVAIKYDLWAKNQVVAVISAPTLDQMNENILSNSNNLLNTFQQKSDERLISNLYNPEFEQKTVEGKLLKEYGWIIYVQKDFKILLDEPKEKFVLFEKAQVSDLKLLFFIYWIDNAAPDYLNQDSIKIIRDRLANKFYKSVGDSFFVFVSEDGFVVNEVDFNGRYAIFTQGLWQNKFENSGPFVNYFFFDEKAERIYMIDGLIYAPKYYKRNLIQQVDVTLQSFRTKSELTEERIEELLKAVKN
jgi:Domain of unknown function (DUF4837)